MRKAVLGQVATINPAGPRNGELLSDELVDFVPMASVSEAGDVNISERRTVARVSKGFTAFQSDDVLVAKITPCFENNKIALAKVRTRYAFGSTEFHVIRCSNGELDPRYLTHFLRQDRVRNAGEKRMTGSAGQRRVPKVFLEELEIPLPPLDEQKRIAAILDQADNLRRLRQRAIDRLNELGQAIFYEMFGDPSTNAHGYEAKPLGAVCDVRDGTHNSPKYVDEGYPLLTSKNFSSGRLSFEGAYLISKTDYENINKRSKVDIGDIIMPMIGTIGSPVIVNVEPRFAIKNVALLKLGQSKIDGFYLRALLAGDFFEKKVAKSGRGGTQKFVSLGDLRALEVPVPPIEEQQNYAERIAALEAAGAMQSRQLHAFEAFFSSLQHRAFTNQL